MILLSRGSPSQRRAGTSIAGSLILSLSWLAIRELGQSRGRLYIVGVGLTSFLWVHDVPHGIRHLWATLLPHHLVLNSAVGVAGLRLEVLLSKSAHIPQWGEGQDQSAGWQGTSMGSNGDHHWWGGKESSNGRWHRSCHTHHSEFWIHKWQTDSKTLSAGHSGVSLLSLCVVILICGCLLLYILRCDHWWTNLGKMY